MELTGNLSDFALTDILQILALSRKSGTLSLESGGVHGRIIVDQGRIIQASMRPGSPFSERLLHEDHITPENLSTLKQFASKMEGVWGLKELLLESGLMDIEALESAARRHIHDTVGALVNLEKGRFGIELNYLEPVDVLDEVVLLYGLDVGEVLLGAAKEIDESKRDELLMASKSVAAMSDNGLNAWRQSAVAEERVQEEPRRSQPVEEVKEEARELVAEGQDRASRLCSLLAELRSHSFEAEVSLLIMRYASEVATRGVLFVVKDDEVCGLGQFGVTATDNGQAPDDRVRGIRIPIGQQTIFDQVIRTGQPFIGHMPNNHWHAEMLKKIGGNGAPLSAFALPLVCNDQPIFVFYGDNYPGKSELNGIDELVALVNQASIVLEKLVLERMINELRQRRP
ncbi:MAG: hypothetical protein DMF61_19615 [Blastocatellia bacterium AA13]|nr:MAG: hypothetical protein DMF61_19615 [Blastocatellia bacterium AA13]